MTSARLLESSRGSLLGSLMLVSSCTSDAPNAEMVSNVRDSAGIRLVEFGRDPRTTARLGVELLYDYGHGTGDYSFQMVLRGALQPDADAVVADLGNQEVVVIENDGRSGAILARSGQGPSEVRWVSSVHVTGQDTIWVEDDGNSKVMLFLNRALERTVSMQGVVDLRGGLGLQGFDESGRFLMSTSSFRSKFEQPWLPGHMVRFDPDTRTIDTLGSYDMAARSPEERANPFGPQGVITFAGDGFVHARTDLPELIWREPDGVIRQIVRWVPDRTYPTDQHWNDFTTSLEHELKRVNPTVGGAELAGFVERQIARFEVKPDEPLPLFGLIHGDDQGGVWLSEFVPGPTPRPTRYQIVSPSGAWVGTVEFPAPFFVLDVRDDLVLGVSLDELDVQGIAVYRYQRSAP